MLSEIPQSRWNQGTGDQNILKSDFRKLESAILQTFQAFSRRGLIWVNNTTVQLPATANCPAQLLLAGFDDVLHPGILIPAGLTDGIYRANTGPVSCVLGSSGQQWGNLKASNWYAVLAIAASGVAAFTLKAMPYLRVKSQASQVISLGTNLNAANGIGYGFVTDELAGGQIYVLTGASAGLMAPITHNNNDNATGGTITYGGSALTVAQGDWFICLPPTNFLRLADVHSNTQSQITCVDDFVFGKWPYVFQPVDSGGSASTYTYPDPWFAPLAVTQVLETGIGGGDQGSDTSSGYGGATDILYPLTVSPGTPYSVVIGLGQTGYPRSAGATSLGSLRSLAGGGGTGSSGLGQYGTGSLNASGNGGNGILILERQK